MSFELIELKGERKRQFQGMSRYGYTPQTALADLIDNSLSAGATVIQIDISEQIDGSAKVYISDNGKGITASRLPIAMAIGAPEEIQNSRLSKFGFGLKTASLEISPDGFSIVSRSRETGELVAASLLESDQEGTGGINARIWSREAIEETWVRYLDRVAGHGCHGTTVIWENADLKEADRRGGRPGNAEQQKERIKNRISTYLGMVFHRWLEGAAQAGPQVRIIFQGEDVVPWNPLSPEYLDSEQVSPIKPILVTDDYGQNIELRLSPWVIKKNVPKTEATEKARKNAFHQGIYLYRMDRIINNPTWLGIQPAKRDPLNGLRFALELDSRLDDAIHLDVKKSHVDLTDEILEQITPIIQNYIRQEEERANTGQAKANKSATPFEVLEQTSRRYKEIDTIAPSVRPMRQSATEVITTNEAGQELPLHLKELPSRLDASDTIHLVAAFETNGHLWETRTSRDGSLQILINEDHDFFQKVILPSGEAQIQGFLWMMLAFSKAELATQYSEFKLQFNHMRRHISETLEMYSEDIELPILKVIDE
jgi:hypothetical protein